MSGSTRRKLRSEITRAPNLDDSDEGTAARTRPLSYDEIMLKRKNKKELEAGESENTRCEENTSHLGRHSRDSNHVPVKNSHDHLREDSSKKKEEKTSRKEESYGKSKNKESRGSEGKSKHKHDKDVRNSKDTVKTENRGHGRSKLEESSRDITHYDHEKRYHRESAVQDKNTERSKLDESSRDNSKYDHEKRYHRESAVQDKNTERSKLNESSRDNSKYDHEKRYHRESTLQDKNTERSKLDESSRDNSKYDHEKRHHRESAVQDKNTERNKGGHERENKRKDRTGEDERYRTKDAVKKHDSGSRRGTEISERKEKTELSNSRHEESRSKRRRSRSQEHVKDKDRRSSSPSPKTRKYVSSHGLDRGEHSLHSQRDRSRNHSDAERSKMSSNGSATHHRRHGGSSSGLGGYSPRKRKTEAAVKTPSPPLRSPERKSAGWDLPPAGGDGNRNISGSVVSGPQLLPQTKSSNMMEFAAGISVAASLGKPLSAILSTNLSAFKDSSIDSVQLTQATRPMRRLYIDNIPASASEKDITEFFNSFLLSSGVNHIRGTRPCISCMIHKEKGQALVEFLTPEDASAALAFDGRSLSGSIIKIRRPKDFVESGSSERSKPSLERSKPPSEKSKSEADVISEVVKDSPHKIFIGGIAEGLSSEMIMEIVSAFGPLKAYRFQINEDLDGPCVFLEYADPSVTSKACAGLNGMKLGGRILTVAQAVLNTSYVENSGSRQFYGIPEHVKPLLEMPTPVLKLSNVLDHDALMLLSETDLDEILEDIRLECCRFGSVVSINVVKTSNMGTSILETNEVADDLKPNQPQEEESREHDLNVESGEGVVDHDDGDGDEVEPPSIVNELDAGDSAKEGDTHDLAPVTTTIGVEGATVATRTEDLKEADKKVPQKCDGESAANHLEELAVTDCSTAEEDTGKTDDHQEVPIQKSEVESELHPSENMDIEKSGNGETPSASVVPEFDKSTSKLQEAIPVANDSAPSNQGAKENGVQKENANDIEDVFELGSVLVEFRRTEASCMAAHSLHRRVFDDRIVTVEYVPLDAYRARFPK